MKYFYTAAIIIGVILLGVIALQPKASAPVLGDSGTPNVLTSLTASSVTLTNGTSTLVLNGASGRIYAYICSLPQNTTSTFLTVSGKQNASGTTVGVPATAGNGIYLAVNTCFKIDNSDLMNGLINGYANSSNTLSLEYQ